MPWLATVLLPLAAAQELSIAIDPALAAEAGIDAEAVAAQVRDATEGTLRLDAPEAFLRQMATANALATKGMGVDYASNPQRFFVGGAIGTAVDGVGLRFVRGEGALPEGGFAFQAAANAGVNLGILSPDKSFLRRFVVSANGLWGAGVSGAFDATLYNLGAHVQFKLIRPPHEGLVEWGGIDLTGGYELSSYALELSTGLPVEVDGLSWEANGSFDVRASSRTIPLEVSTNLRVFVVTVYAGGAVDLRREAYATGEMSVDGTITATVQGEAYDIGTVSARLDAEGDAAARYVPRVFGGVQTNVLWFKVYGHLNATFDGSYAGHLGVRVAM